MNSTYKSLFLLDKETIHLNHGSFGACPKPIFDALVSWQKKLEFNPTKFLAFDIFVHLEKSRESLSEYINCDKNDIVFFPNPSTALNTVIKSLDLKKDDEILTTNHEYGALDKTWNFICKNTGAKYIKQNIKLPLKSKNEFINTFIKGINKNTKVIFISHITSSTGLIFPAEELCQIARENNIFCIIDGAHVPAHIDLDIKKLNPDIYTGACHKWMCAPKGTAFLYAKKNIQDDINPLVVSWGYDAEIPGVSKYLDYHQWQGTNDPSPYLTVPDVIAFLKEYNWKDVSLNCRKINIEARKLVNKTLNKMPISEDEFIGQMSAIEIKCTDSIQLIKKIYEDFKIVVPIVKWENKMLLRFSIQAYNSMEDIEKLIFAMKKLKL
tara:strand:- start:4059 stop:5201 length:1143 start_codon:yes stop_codon:yes gene_type:complete